MRNKAQHTTFEAKQNYFNNTCNEHSNDLKSLWKCLKEFGLPSKSNSSSSCDNIGLKLNCNLCFDKQKVADGFNTFFTAVAAKLVSNLPNPSFNFDGNFVNCFYARKGVIKNSFFFSLVSENTLLKYLNKLHSNKSTGLDGIPARFIVDCSSIIACPLAHVINLSFIRGTLPPWFEISKSCAFV